MQLRQLRNALERLVAAKQFVAANTGQHDLESPVTRQLGDGERIQAIDAWLIGGLDEALEEVETGRGIEAPLMMRRAEVPGRTPRQRSLVVRLAGEGDRERVDLSNA